jgi:heat shock protein HslJ
MEHTLSKALVTAAALGTLLVSACSKPEQPLETANDSLGGIVWRLSEISGQQISLPAEAKPATIMFDEGTGQASGFSGVNQFHGSYKLDGSKISFGPLISTRMAGPPELMEIESNFLNVVSSDVEFTISDGVLEFAHGESVVARFTTDPE